jgi:hypothetical protein
VTCPIRLTSWLTALLLAVIQAWGHRNATNPDGLSYLDLAHAFLAGDLRAAIDPYWGPLYPALLGLGLGLARPAPEWVLPLVHGVNLAIFFAALISFDWFLKELLRCRNRRGADPGSAPALNDTGLAIFAYAVFTYSALGLVGLGLITPDLSVVAGSFAAAALVLRLCRRGSRWATALQLGLALGVTYLTKSVMFPLGAIIIVSLAFAPSLQHVRLQSVGLASVAFVAVASLLVVPISMKTGGVTFGTAGKLTYAFIVNKVPYTNWQGDSTSGGSKPLHPPKRLSNNPKVYEYSAHLKGTYPPWFDVTYWTLGLRTEVSGRNQARRLLRSGEFYANLFIGSAGVAATLLVALVWLHSNATASMRELRRFFPLLVFGLGGLLIYAPVHLDERFLGALAALCWILPVAAARVIQPTASERYLERASVVCAICLMLAVGIPSVRDAKKLAGGPNPHPRIATFLSSLGVRGGDRVVHVGVERGTNPGSSFDAFWAYLAGVHIVAEVPEGKDFLCAPRWATERLYTEFAHLGARAVVASTMPSRWCASGWRKIQDTDYYVRLLDGKRR